jgi:hypothetical protein
MDAVVTGQVRDVQKSGGLSHPASMTLVIKTVETHSARYALDTSELTVKQDSHDERNVVIIGGSAGAGALIGAAAGGGKGAAIGALVGGGAGTLGAFLSGKRELNLPAETVLTFYISTLNISPKELAKLPMAPVVVAERPVENHEVRAVYDDRDRDHDAYAVEARPRDDSDADRDFHDRDHVPSRYVVFSDYERSRIIHWFREEGDRVPGLHDRVPPGLEKQIREQSTLPRPLEDRVQSLPWDLERMLMPLPYGYRRVMLGGKILILEDRTFFVCDVIDLR